MGRRSSILLCPPGISTFPRRHMHAVQLIISGISREYEVEQLHIGDLPKSVSTGRSYPRLRVAGELQP